MRSFEFNSSPANHLEQVSEVARRKNMVFLAVSQLLFLYFFLIKKTTMRGSGDPSLMGMMGPSLPEAGGEERLLVTKSENSLFHRAAKHE